jgi:DNA-directed RNA polymerase subunit RPC12/RpoP
MKPDEYYRTPRCESCGAQSYRIDAWMNSRDTRTTACTCSGYVMLTHRPPWPHRIGSPYCWFRKDGTQRMPGDADFKDYELEQRQAHGIV